MKAPAIFFFLLLASSTAVAGITVGCTSGNCEDGFGEFRYKGGDSYTGFWKSGIRYGRGTYRYTDGSRFVGNYVNNMRHGKGTYVSATGQKISGRWAKGSIATERSEVRGLIKPVLAKTAGADTGNVLNAMTLRPSEAIAPEAIDPEQREKFEAEAMLLVQACAGYTAEDIKAFTYLYAVSVDDATELYFRFKAYSSDGVSLKADVLEWTLKFKKYHSGIYEQSIKSGDYYWGECQ